MIQSGGPFGLLEAAFRTGIVVSKREEPMLVTNTTNYLANKKVNELKKKFTRTSCSQLTLKNNEIKDIKNVIKSLESSGIL